MYRARKYWLDEDGGGAPAPLAAEDAYSGTYYCPINLPAGQADATAQVLYDSARYTSSRMAVDVVAADGQPHRMHIGSEARPDMNKRGALVHGCEIGIYCHLTSGSWASSDELYLGARIIVAPQDYDGRAQLDPGYGMWQVFGGGAAEMFEPAVFANGRQNCWEERIFRTRHTTDVALDLWKHHRFIPFKRRLEWNEGLFLYLELHPNSVGLTGAGNFLNLWCRTLVSDHNR